MGMMALGDKEDMSCSKHGRGYDVMVYCYSCQVLLCPRCIAKSSISDTELLHRDHVFLEIKEACDMFKDEIEKLHGRLTDFMKRKKVIKSELQNRVQKLKIETLRRQTVLKRRVTGLKDTVDKRQSQFGHCLESVLQPAIERSEQHHRDVDFDVVSGDGLLGMVEALQSLPAHKSVTFLKGFNRLKESVEQHLAKSTCDLAAYNDDLNELKLFKSVDLNFVKERKLLAQSFLGPSKEVLKPKILSDWSTIGSTSASLIWRCNSNVALVRSFLVCYRAVTSHDLRTESLSYKQLALLTDIETLRKSGFTCLRLTRFLPKRSQVVLRNLCPHTNYVVSIIAVNELACSMPCVFYFQTGNKPTELKSCITTRLSRQLFLDRVVNFSRKPLVLFIKTALFVYFLLTSYTTIACRDKLLQDICHAANIVGLYNITRSLCSSILPPVISLPPEPDPVVLNTYDKICSWLYGFVKV